MAIPPTPRHHDRDIPLPELIILWITGVFAMLALVRSLMRFCNICCCRRTQEDDLPQRPPTLPPPPPPWPPSMAINIQQQPPNPTRPAPNIAINVMPPPVPPQAPPPPARRPAISEFMDSVSWAIGAIARDMFNNEVK